jgi:hypothetical protein
MNRIACSMSALFLAASLGVIAGCEEKPAPAPAGSPKPAAGAPAAPKPDADKHDHVHGAGTDLGTITIGSFTLKVSQEHAIEEGKDAGFEIAVSGGKPSAIRAWIGTEDAKGSVKGKAVTEGDGFDAHVETPKPIPAGSRLWLEVESADGKKATGSIAYK